jgi:DNA invertase Pin-like site-specific DNA recombinase
MNSGNRGLSFAKTLQGHNLVPQQCYRPVRMLFISNAFWILARDNCLRRGWEITDEYVDSCISGKKERRPQLDRLLADCRRRRVDIVLVYRYDRFAHSQRHLVNALEEFRALGIDFNSLHEGVDTSTPNGRLVFGIFASIAEFERELIRDRVKSGIAAARSKGKTLGRPRVAVDAARIAALRSQGLSWARIGEQLGLGEGTVRRSATTSGKNPSKTTGVTTVESAFR